MTTTDTTVQNLIINKLTQAQYEAITTPSDTELYLTPDTTDQDIADAISAHNTSASAHANLIPAQSGNSGKFLTTNGTSTSWATVDALPSQTSQSGKFLTTNGTTASWAEVPTEIPSQSGQSGKYLTTNGTSVSWGTVDALPSQTSQSGKFLTTNGTTASWANVPSPNDGTLTIQFNGTTVETFTANSSSNKTANIQATQVVWRKYTTT